MAPERAAARRSPRSFGAFDGLSVLVAVLRTDGLVSTRREAQTIYYALADGPAQRIIETLHGIYCGTSTKAC